MYIKDGFPMEKNPGTGKATMDSMFASCPKRRDKIGYPVAICQLCGENTPITREEEAMIYGYPPQPYVCPLCRCLLNEAEESNDSRIQSGQYDPFTINHHDINNTEVLKNECYDEEFESDETSDDEYEEFCREYETDHQGGGAKAGCHDDLQTEAEYPHMVRVELLMEVHITIM